MKKAAIKTTAKAPAAGIVYSIAAADLAGHMFKVSLTVKRRPPSARYLPAGLDPGQLHDPRIFAQHRQHPRRVRRQAVALTKLDKHSWQAAPARAP
jgi:hypothetical protein